MRRAVKLLQRLRFRLWAVRLRLALRRKGGRLALDAPSGAHLKGAPRLDISPAKEDSGTFHLKIGRGVAIGKGVSIRIDAGGDNTLVVGDGTVLQDGVRLWLFAGRIAIGPRTSMNPDALALFFGKAQKRQIIQVDEAVQ